MITDIGGSASHAAIVAREFGIPVSSIPRPRPPASPTASVCVWTARPGRPRR
ncbi:PEP-utilizing enzyme [Nocardia sp. NPDC049707]|uniref:PEP-utilizing enzyme n=1 Tax=Nocardia sp. NPDC049707 TaxID=3154735 RepID=UPI0034302B73